MFITNTNENQNVCNQNSATQLLISELLRFFDDNDIVDTSKHTSTEKKQQLAKDLLRLNPKLNLVTTQLSQIDKTYELVIEMTKGDQTKSKQTFTAETIYEAVLVAVSWISKENTQHNLDSELLNMLPNNN